jgi:hypothetical protein
VPDFTPDDVVTSLESERGANPDLVALLGYVGEAKGENAYDRIRIYSDPSLTRWIEVPKTNVARREMLSQPRGGLSAASLVWVDGATLREEFAEAPERLQLEYLNDRAELFFEPPRSLLEAAEYMTMSADYQYAMGTPRPTRHPRYHC